MIEKNYNIEKTQHQYFQFYFYEYYIRMINILLGFPSVPAVMAGLSSPPEKRGFASNGGELIATTKRGCQVAVIRIPLHVNELIISKSARKHNTPSHHHHL
jgi:hypothetical protein